MNNWNEAIQQIYGQEAEEANKPPPQTGLSATEALDAATGYAKAVESEICSWCEGAARAIRQRRLPMSDQPFEADSLQDVGRRLTVDYKSDGASEWRRWCVQEVKADALPGHVGHQVGMAVGAAVALAFAVELRVSIAEPPTEKLSDCP